MSIEPMVSLALKELLRAVDRIFFSSLTARVGGLRVTVAGPFAKANIDERLAKLETARDNMTEALHALDALQELANENKRDLELLNAAIVEAEVGKSTVAKELESLKALAALDGQSVRKALGLPTPQDVWRDRLIAFCLGVLASVIAAFIWEYAIKPHL